MAAPGQNCKVCSDATLRNQVDHLISDGLSDDGVSRALESIGIVISKSGILRHRQNHSPSAPPAGVELPADMEIPRAKLEASSPMETEANELMESLSKVTAVDVAKERLARETLLGKILETHLVITTVALERFKRGEGRYPTEMIKGLTAVGSLYEKTAILTSSEGATKDAIIEREIQRRENLAREDARVHGLAGENHPFLRSEHYIQGFFFEFGGRNTDTQEINPRIEYAWKQGIEQGKRERQAKKAESLESTL